MKYYQTIIKLKGRTISHPYGALNRAENALKKMSENNTFVYGYIVKNEKDAPIEDGEFMVVCTPTTYRKF